MAINRQTSIIKTPFEHTAELKSVNTDQTFPYMLHASKLFAHLCSLMIMFANSLEPDPLRRTERTDMDPNCLTLIVFLKELSEKIDFEKNQQTTSGGQSVKINLLVK